MPAGGKQVVVGHDDRRCLQVAAAAVPQTAHEVVAHLRQIDAQQREVVLADVAQEFVDLLRPQHPVVGLTAVDGRAARIGKIAHQLRVFLLGKPVEHRAHATKLLHQRPLLILVDVPIDFLLVLVSVGEIVLALVLPQLFVDLILPVCGEMDAR